MELKTYFHNYEGRGILSLLDPLLTSGSDGDARDRVRMIHRHLSEGGRIYVKINKGARKGSIGYLNVKPEDFKDFPTVYLQRKNESYPYELAKKQYEIKFDDSKSVIKFELLCYGNKPMVHSMTVFGEVPDGKTVFKYKTNPKPVAVRPKMYDQFGIELEEGQTIITNYGTKNDFYTALAKITRITDAGTIFIKTIPTPGRPNSVEERYGIYSVNCMVVDDQFMNRILTAQLSK